MSAWKTIENAPSGAWIKTLFSSGDEGVHIKHGEPGWWEDETGDWSVEAAQNNGHGIVSWDYLPADYEVSDYEGTLRYKEPKAASPSDTKETR